MREFPGESQRGGEVLEEARDGRIENLKAQVCVIQGNNVILASWFPKTTLQSIIRCEM